MVVPTGDDEPECSRSYSNETLDRPKSVGAGVSVCDSQKLVQASTIRGGAGRGQASFKRNSHSTVTKNSAVIDTLNTSSPF